MITTSPQVQTENWLTVPERGTIAGIRALFWIAHRLGRGAVRAFVALVVGYYVLRDSHLRAASKEWWTTIEGEPPSLSKIYSHVRRFANVSVDRVFLLSGRRDLFRLTRDGNGHLEALEKEKKGAILLGAHLGSFEAMRLGAREESFTINIVGNFTNARMINAVLEQLSSHNTTRVISAVPGDVGFVFDIQERIERGEMVAILADRVADHHAAMTVDFLGRPARFPTGPFQLAALLKCPVYLTFGVFREPNLYELSCKPFADRIELPRARRREALREVVQRFARELESKARSAPDNWFNFYRFWEQPE